MRITFLGDKSFKLYPDYVHALVFYYVKNVLQKLRAKTFFNYMFPKKKKKKALNTEIPTPEVCGFAINFEL